jgi:hypothetical protein
VQSPRLPMGAPMSHTCHWPGCTQKVPPRMWGCKPHWYQLPPMLRVKIWRTYRPGQEVTKTPSPAYIAAAQEVQRWLRSQETERT